MKTRRPVRVLDPEPPRFRLRALTLAFIAFGVGLLCLLSVLQSRKPAPAPQVKSAEPEWPPGFVEWQGLPPASATPSSTASGSSSATPRNP